MGKTKKTQKDKIKSSKKPANGRETASHSTDNTNEGEIDGMKIVKDSNRSTDDIQAPGHSSQIAHEGKKDKKDRCRSNENIQSAGQSPQNVHKGKKEKDRCRYTDSILAAGYSPAESTKEGKKGKNNYIRPTCKVQTAEQKSENVGSDVEDETLKEIIEENVRVFKDLHEMKYSEVMHSKQYKFMLDFLAEHQHDFNEFFTSSEEPNLAKHYARCLDIMKDRYNRSISAEDDLTAPNSQGREEISAIKELENDGNENITSTSAYTESYLDEIIILEKNNSKEGDKRSNDKDSPSDDVQKATPSPQKVLKRKKYEKANKYTDTIVTSGSSPQNVDDKNEGMKRKDSNISISSFQESELSSHERKLEIKDETLIGQIDEVEGNLGDTKTIPELKHSKNTVKKISPEKNKCKKSLPDFNHDLKEFLKSLSSKLIEEMKNRKGGESTLNILKERQHIFSTEKETVKSAANEETRVSKRLAGQENDIIKELKKVESEKTGNKSKKEIDRSAGCIQTDEHSQPNGIEGKKDGRNCRNDKVKCNEDYQKSHFDRDMQKSLPKTKECLRKKKDIFQMKDPNNMTKSIIPMETKIKKKSSDDFFTFQDFELDNQAKERQGVETELQFVKEERDFLSSDKETVTVAENTEIHEEVSTELEYEATQEIRASGKRDADLKVEIIRLEKKDIHFEFETNGDKHILIGGYYFFLKEGEPRSIVTGVEKENIEISFIGSLIFISTKNSEFEISVRKPNFAKQTDDTTQTDILQ